jgi:hypothetical protein
MCGNGICVEHLGGAAPNTYECVKDPCTGTLTCACAGSACTAAGLQCIQTNQSTVTCGQ